MTDKAKSYAALIAGCAGVFWPGAFIFGFPGVMSPHWQAWMEVGRAEIGQCLFFVLAAVGGGMFFVGRLQLRFGSARMCLIGGVLCGLNAFWVGRIESVGWLYAWAFSAGLASCFTYLPSITVIQQHFPANRGLVSGIFNTLFGLSAGIMSPVFGLLIELMGYRPMTVLLAVAAGLTGIAAAGFVRPPGRLVETAVSASTGVVRRDLTVGQSLRTRNFWSFWLIWALGGAAGISMVTNSVDFGLNRGWTRPGRF